MNNFIRNLNIILQYNFFKKDLTYTNKGAIIRMYQRGNNILKEVLV